MPMALYEQPMKHNTEPIEKKEAEKQIIEITANQKN